MRGTTSPISPDGTQKHTGSIGVVRTLATGVAIALFMISGGCWCGDTRYGYECERAQWGDDTPGASVTAIGTTRIAAAGQTLFIPGAAHVSGANGTNWRSDVEVQATGGSAASYSIELFKRDRANTSPPKKSYTLAAGRSQRYADILGTVFGFSGAGALRITLSSGTVIVTSRTYNTTSSGTYGQFIAGALEGTTVGTSQHGRVVQLSQSTSASNGYRTNLGLVNTTSKTLSVRVDFYRSNGSSLGSKSYGLDPYEMRQIDKVFTKVTGSAVDDGYLIVSTSTSGGSFFAYGSVVDNRTGDPVYIPAKVLSGAPPGGGPSPTPTPPPSGNLDLEPYTPDGWQGPLVVSGTDGTHTSGGLNGGWGTYIDWCFSNYGPADAVFPAGTYIVSLLLDGDTLINFNSSKDFTLESGYYYHYDDWETFDIDSGHHTVTMVVDPQHALAESDRGNNSASYIGDWVFVGAPAREAVVRVIDIPVTSLRKEALPEEGAGPLGSLSRKATGGTATVFIPASAHATGYGGAVWRTDLELHNAGTTTMSCAVDLLKKNTTNSSPASHTYTVKPGRALRLGDVLGSKFSFSGTAALRIRLSGGKGVVTSRTYNQTGHGTYGQFIGAVPESEAIGTSGQAAIIQLTHNRSTSSGFRTNIGLLNTTTSPMDVTIDLYRSNGSKLGSIPVHLKTLSFTQVDKLYEKVTGGDVGDGYALISTNTSGGKFLAYASVIDNRTGDPIYIPAVATSAGGSGGGGTGPMGPGEIVQAIDIFAQGLKGVTDNDLETILISVLDHGLDATLDSATQMGDQITTVTRISKGIRISLTGSSTHGTMTGTYSGYTHTSNTAGWDYNHTFSSVVIGGKTVPFTVTRGHVTASRSGSHVVADITVNASGSGASATGTAHVDTSVCTSTPISGSIDVTVGGKTSTVTFTNECGIYKLKTPGSVGIRLQNLKNSQWQYIDTTCNDGSHTTAPTFDFCLLTDGPLGTDPIGVTFSKCLTGWGYTGFASGTATENALHLEFTVTDSTQGMDWTFTGTYDAVATSVNYSVYRGTLRVHASGGYHDCQGDLVIEDFDMGGCGMEYGQLPICNGALSCQ